MAATKPHMRGGVGMSEALRNAEALFESQTVVEIREASLYIYYKI